MLPLLHALRWRWPLLLLVAIPIVVGSVLYAESLPSEYDGVVVVAFSPQPEGGGNADVVRLLLSKYAVYASAPETLTSVAARYAVAPSELSSGVSVDVPGDGGNLQIRVRLGSPEAAAAAANDLATRVERLSERDPLVEAETISPALQPSQPAAPPRRLLQLVGAVVALLAGAAAAIVAEHLRPRLWDVDAIEAVVGAPVVVRLPRVDAEAAEPFVSLADPAVGASVRALRAFLARTAVVGPSVLAVASPSRGSGTSTTASLLAASFALAGSRTLLVDADPVSPDIAGRFDVDSQPALGDVLAGNVPLDLAVRATAQSGLTVLPGSHRSDGADLLAAHGRVLLAEVRSAYDAVIVDVPALLDGDAGLTVVSNADVVILVVPERSASTDVQAASSAMWRLHGTPVGVVTTRPRQARRFQRRVLLDEPHDRTPQAVGAAPGEQA